MINEQGHVMFGDFGAATQLHNLSGVQQQQFERIEVRAFGNLLDDLLNYCNVLETGENSKLTDLALFEKVSNIRYACLNDDISHRPSFADIKELVTFS
jgi:hypothetical protein